MRHEWKRWDDPEKTFAQKFMSGPQRRCDNCGAVQTKNAKHEWMRVVGYRWWPLV